MIETECFDATKGLDITERKPGRYGWPVSWDIIFDLKVDQEGDEAKYLALLAEEAKLR